MFARQTLAMTSLTPDLVPQDAPADAWNTGANVMFRNGEAMRAWGDLPTLAGATGPIRAMVYCEPFDTPFWAYCTPSGIFAHDGTTEHDITPAWWSETDPAATYTATVLNGLPFFNASDRDPAFWDGVTSNPAQALPGWPIGGRCLAMRAHKAFLFALGFESEGEMRVRWSDAAEAGTVPQHWTPAADNLAGFVDLAPARTPVLDGATSRDAFLIYKQDTVWAASFVGGNAVFQFRKLVGQGIAATGAVCRGPEDVHLYLGADGDAYLTDGVSTRSVLDGRAQRTFYTLFSSAQGGAFCAATLRREKLGMIGVPSGDTNLASVAMIYDFASGDIGFRDLPGCYVLAEGRLLTPAAGVSRTWDDAVGDWDSANYPWLGLQTPATADDVLGAGVGAWCVTNPEVDDFADGPVAARLEKLGMSFGNADQRKLVRRVWPRITGNTGGTLQVRLGGQEITNGPVSWSPPVTVEIGAAEPLETFASGRFIALEVSSKGGAPWRLGSIDVEYRELGQW